MKLRFEDKQCIVCGKTFKFCYDKDTREIKTKCFYSRMRKYYFTGWYYRFPVNSLDLNDLRDNPVFRNRFWKIIGFTKIQRWLVYKVWRLFYGWQTIPYIECPACCKEGNDKAQKLSVGEKYG